MVAKLTEVIREVNKDLKEYDSYYSFASRLPELDEERCTSFRQWIEIRVNKQIFLDVPELSEYVEKFNGELFEVVSIIDQDDKKCRFREVEVTINTTRLRHPYGGHGHPYHDDPSGSACR